MDWKIPRASSEPIPPWLQWFREMRASSTTGAVQFRPPRFPPRPFLPWPRLHSTAMDAPAVTDSSGATVALLWEGYFP